MVDRYNQIDELDQALADIRARAEALRDQVRSFQPELHTTVKTIAKDFRSLQLKIEEILNDLERKKIL